MKNRVQHFLAERGLTPYRFIKDTGIAFSTGYKLAKDPDHLPSITVLKTICDRYQIQPNEILVWIPDHN